VVIKKSDIEAFRATYINVSIHVSSWSR